MVATGQSWRGASCGSDSLPACGWLEKARCSTGRVRTASGLGSRQVATCWSICLELESEGRGYHLVGHSHGGSVIWHALCRARLYRKDLTCLRSWSTVGTPYLQHRTRSMWHVLNIINLLLAAILLRPAYYTLQKLTQVAGAALLGRDEGITLARTGVAKSMPLTRDIGLRVLEWLGVSVTETAQGIQLGSYDPAAGRSLLRVSIPQHRRLGDPRCGHSLRVRLSEPCHVLSRSVAGIAVDPQGGEHGAGRDAHVSRAWLGIWSPEDEAINGLRTTIKLSISFVSRISLRESVLFSDWLSLVSRPYHWILIRFYNTMLRPMLDGVVRSHVIKTALGNNRPGAEVMSVSPGAHRVDRSALPARLAALRRFPPRPTGTHATSRPSCGTCWPSHRLSAACSRCGDTMTGRELVHTSYFDHDEILDLLAANIAWAADTPQRLTTGTARSLALWGWFRQFKQGLGVHVADPESEPSVVAFPTPTRVVPRRRREAA